VSACEALLLKLDAVAGFRTAARAETGAPLAPERTERAFAPPAAPLVVVVVVAVEDLAGVRLAGAGEDEAVREAVGSRRGVPEGGLVAAAVDIGNCLSLLVVRCEAVLQTMWRATALRGTGTVGGTRGPAAKYSG
jgi:hypothetical protein